MERRGTSKGLRIAWPGAAAASRTGEEGLRVPGKLALQASIRHRWQESSGPRLTGQAVPVPATVVGVLPSSRIGQRSRPATDTIREVPRRPTRRGRGDPTEP